MDTPTASAQYWHEYNIRDLTIGHVLAHQAEKNPSKIYLTDLESGRSYSFAEVHQISDSIATGLINLGIRRGDHVTLMMENCAEHLLMHFAIGKIGAVGVPINTAARGALLAYFLNQSDSKCFVAEGDHIARFLEIAAETPKVSQVVAVGDNVPQSRAGAPAITPYRTLETTPPAPVSQGARFSDIAMIMYTSGTTGPSKGVMFPHARLFFWERMGEQINNVTGNDTYYICLPLFHAAGLLGGAYLMAGLGGSLALARRFSASRYWSDIRTSGATITTMMGSIPQILWSQPPSPQDREHKLRVVNLSPFPKFVIEFQERFNIPHVAGGYGLTDYGAVTMLTEKDLPAKLGACGPTHFDWQLRILDEEDFPLGPHQVGEIALWNPTPWHTSFGYYNMPEATVATRRNGWFHTGDRGYLDEDGFLWFVDRKKDSIRRRGENISAYEVEQVIMSHPAVADVAVYPLASEMGEDEVATSIVLRAGATLTEASLIEFCRNNMAYFMVPRFVQFLSDLPRNFSQKIEKYKLKAAAEADRTALWDREKAGIKITR